MLEVVKVRVVRHDAERRNVCLQSEWAGAGRLCVGKSWREKKLITLKIHRRRDIWEKEEDSFLQRFVTLRSVSQSLGSKAITGRSLGGRGQR